MSLIPSAPFAHLLLSSSHTILNRPSHEATPSREDYSATGRQLRNFSRAGRLRRSNRSELKLVRCRSSLGRRGDLAPATSCVAGNSPCSAHRAVASTFSQATRLPLPAFAAVTAWQAAAAADTAATTAPPL